jgi:C4-dicarboxylate-specific signal transduction histidine kinase
LTSQAEQRQSPRGHLVIVDDEPVILDLLASLFRGEYDVHAFASGTEALEHLQQHGVDVLLTDKNLPDLGGLELLRHAHRVAEDAEVLIITGYASLETALEALQEGAFDYIVKPPKSIFDVRRKVEQAFARQAIVREKRQLVEDLRRKNGELEAALAQVKKVQAELIQSEKLAGIGTLAAGIAHEVSSPLFGIMGLAEAIREEDDLSAAREYAGEIVEYSKAIKEIVVQLSGYSRTAEREYLTTIEAQRVLDDAALLVVRSMGLPEGTVSVTSERGLYFQARTNEVQQVFVNLIKNAVEALRDSGRHGGVRVHARRDEGFVAVTVSDDGPGIPADSLKEIFDPFYTTKPPGKGTGLGLNIVYRIVTRYQGAVSVDSEAGVGTTFTVRFPLQD